MGLKSENLLIATSPTPWFGHLTSPSPSSVSYHFSMKLFCLYTIPGTWALIPETSWQCCGTLSAAISSSRRLLCQISFLSSPGLPRRVSAVPKVVTHSPKLKHEGTNDSTSSNEVTQLQSICQEYIHREHVVCAKKDKLPILLREMTKTWSHKRSVDLSTLYKDFYINTISCSWKIMYVTAHCSRVSKSHRMTDF